MGVSVKENVQCNLYFGNSVPYEIDLAQVTGGRLGCLMSMASSWPSGDDQLSGLAKGENGNLQLIPATKAPLL